MICTFCVYKGFFLAAKQALTFRNFTHSLTDILLALNLYSGIQSHARICRNIQGHSGTIREMFGHAGNTGEYRGIHGNTGA